jgi:acetolactate synthase I/II/III large subunit
MNGAERVCHTLQQLRVECVFGLPGTQNVRLFEALRKSGLRCVVPVDEGSAAFMASGYARATGRVGVLTTIPGPGFAYALPGIVEARHDSVALLWITLRQADLGRAFQLQRIDHVALASPVVKRCLHVDRAADLSRLVAEAWNEARSGEPGPVLLEIDAALLDEPCDVEYAIPAPAAELADLQPLVERLNRSAYPVIFAGQGAQGAAEGVRQLARRLRAPVMFTSSGRGVLADADELAFVQDFSTGLGKVLPSMLERADLVLALGCKFTHNGSAGGQLALPADKLVRIDTSSDVLAANYPARLAIAARVEDVIAGLADATLPASQWPAAELAELRARLVADAQVPITHEPELPDTVQRSLGAFFAALADAAGGTAVYTADAGLHQALTRRYARVARPRGLLCPSDFQSMGFGLPAAIGAAVADPGARVIACVGDAGLALSAGDLSTAVREGIDLVVVVFNDGQMNLIRRQQVANTGHEFGVALGSLDYASLAQAVGCSYVPVAGDVGEVARQVFGAAGVRLVELRLADVPSFHRQQARSVIREAVRGRVPDGAWRLVKRLVGR